MGMIGGYIAFASNRAVGCRPQGDFQSLRNLRVALVGYLLPLVSQRRRRR